MMGERDPQKQLWSYQVNLDKRVRSDHPLRRINETLELDFVRREVAKFYGTSWEKNQVRPEVVLVNSHDKSSAYQLHCGLFRLVCTNGMVVSDGTFQRISIKHSGFNPESVIEASFKVLTAVPDIMNKVHLFQDRILTDAEQLALATGAAAYRWEDLTKALVSPSMLLNPRRYGDGAKDLWTTLNCVQENIIRGGQRDRSRRRPDGSRMPKSRAIKGIDEDMKLNNALWEMAEVLRNGGAQ